MDFREQSGNRSRSGMLAGRIILFSVFIFFSGVIQSSFFGAAGIFPATPDLLLTAVMGLALFDGEKTGAVAGILAGVLAASLGGSGTAFLPLFYMLAGYITGMAIQSFLVRNLLSWAVYAATAIVLREMLSVLYITAIETDINLLTIFRDTVVPEALMTLIFSVQQFYISKLVTLPFHPKADLE